MKFLITNTELDEQIKLIKKHIRLSMNGVIAESMNSNGIIYKANFGVALPRLKEIAGYFTPNADLARRLWMLEERETMILALMLFPVNQLSENDIIKFSSSINNIELAEQSAMLLFSKSEIAFEISGKLIESNNKFDIITGLLTFSRIYQSIEVCTAISLVDQISSLIPNEDFLIYKTVATTLSRLSRISKEVAEHIIIILNNKKDISKDKSLTFTIENVNQEILFLNYGI